MSRAHERPAGCGADGRKSRARAGVRERCRAPSTRIVDRAIVPTPTPTASTSARKRCACRFAADEVNAVRLPGASAIRPSRLVAALRMTNGRCFEHQREERVVQGGPIARPRGRPPRRRDVGAGTKTRARAPADWDPRRRQRLARCPRRRRVVHTARCVPRGSTVPACSKAWRRSARGRLPSARAPRRAARRLSDGVPDRRSRRRPTPRPHRPADSTRCVHARGRHGTARVPCTRDQSPLRSS